MTGDHIAVMALLGFGLVLGVSIPILVIGYVYRLIKIWK